LKIYIHIPATMENSMDPRAIYWTRPVTCICLCSALDNSLGPVATESPCTKKVHDYCSGKHLLCCKKVCVSDSTFIMLN